MAEVRQGIRDKVTVAVVVEMIEADEEGGDRLNYLK